MEHLYHVLLIRPSDGALAVLFAGHLWYLPVVTDGSGNGCIAPASVVGMLERVGLRGVVRYVGHASDGIGSLTVDWTVVVDLVDVLDETQNEVRWVMPEEVLGMPSLISYQRDVSCAEYLSTRCGGSHGPLTKTRWLESVTSWVYSAAAAAGYEVFGAAHVVRATPLSAVVEFRTKQGVQLFWKGFGTADQSEALLASRLHELCEKAFPRIIAMEPARGWQLSERCPGTSLQQVGWTHARADRVARCLAAIQEPLMANRKLLTDSGARTDSIGEILRTLEARLELAAAAGQLRHLQADRVEDAKNALQWLVGYTDRQVGSPAWIHLDLHPSNIFVSDESVCLIDTTGSWIGPGWLLAPVWRSAIRRHWSDQPTNSGDDQMGDAASRERDDAVADCVWTACLFEHIDDAERVGEFDTAGSSLRQRLAICLIESLCRRQFSSEHIVVCRRMIDLQCAQPAVPAG